MSDSSVTEFIIQELGKRRPVDDIVLAVCQTTGMKWDQAQQLVDQVQSEHHSEIAQKGKSLQLIMGIVSVLIGFVLMIGTGLATMDGIVIIPLRLPVPYLGNAIFFLSGMGLTAGGALGLARMSRQKSQPQQ